MDRESGALVHDSDTLDWFRMRSPATFTSRRIHVSCCIHVVDTLKMHQEAKSTVAVVTLRFSTRQLTKPRQTASRSCLLYVPSGNVAVSRVMVVQRSRESITDEGIWGSVDAGLGVLFAVRLL